MLNWVLRVLARLPFDQFYHQYHSVQLCQRKQDVLGQTNVLRKDSMYGYWLRIGSRCWPHFHSFLISYYGIYLQTAFDS